MKRAALIALFALTVALLTPTAEARKLPDDGLARFDIPKMSSAPTIDGTIDPAEWREAVAVSGLAQQNPGGNLLIMRPTTYYLAWDADALYLACRTWIMPGMKPGAAGRTPNSANAFDPGMEFNIQPMGRNVPAGRADQSFKFFINTMMADGDLARVAVGALIRNWQPTFRRAARLTPPGSAPMGGRWWEAEVVMSIDDFELSGPNRAGDAWRFLLAFNHLPGWMQASIPINSSYFDTSGYPVGTLVENTPAVQVTMDELPGPMDNVAAVQFRVHNPTDKPVTVDLLADFHELVTSGAGREPPIARTVELVKKTEKLTIAPGKTASWEVNQPFGRDMTGRLCGMRYRATQGDRELFRYYSYFKPGYPDKWVRYTPPDADYPLVVQFNPVRNNVLLRADTYYLDDPSVAKSVTYRIVPEGGGEPLASGRIETAENYYFERLFELSRVEPAKYTVETTMHLDGDRTLGPQTADFEKLDEATTFAAWWRNDFGETERVIPPFTAITRKGADVSTIGRTYTLNALGMPAEVVSADRRVAGPARIVVVIDGKPHRIVLDGAPTFEAEQDWRVEFTGRASGAGLDFLAEGWIEQDGLCKISLTCAPRGDKPVTVDALRLEWPIAPDQAECVVCIGSGGNFASHTARTISPDKQGRLWSTLETGKGGSMMAVGSFYPQVWVGNERRGLLWWADSDAGWFPLDDVPAHELIRDGEEVFIRNNVIADRRELAGRRTIVFSYNATPFKPLPVGWRMALHSEDGTFTGKHKVRKDPETGKEIDGWNWLNPPSRDPDEWGRLWAEYKVHADKRIHDVRPFDPAWSRQRDYVHTSVPLSGYGPLTSDASVRYFLPEWGDNTHGGVQRDFMLHLIERATREGGLRTIYFDIFYTKHWTSLLNGMAYELPDGRVQPTFNGFNQRRLMMRVRSLMAERGLMPGGLVTHSTNSYPLVAVPWVDAILDGEWAEIKDTTEADWVDHYSIDRMRAMSVSGNWGVQISWMSLFHVSDKDRMAELFRGFFDYQRLYDTWTGQDRRYPPTAILEWGLNDANLKYVPFWRNEAITCDDADVLVSYWKLPSRVLVLAFNHDGERVKDPALSVDFAKLGLPVGDKNAPVLRPLPAGRRGQEIEDPAPTMDAAAGRVVVSKLRPHTGRYFGIRVENADATKALRSQVEPFVAEEKRSAVLAALLDYGLADVETPRRLTGGQIAGVSAGGEGVEIAAMWRTDDRVLLAVRNTDDKPVDATVPVDLDVLNLRPELPWQQFVRVRTFGGGQATLDYYAETLSLPKLGPGEARLVAVRRF